MYRCIYQCICICIYTYIYICKESHEDEYDDYAYDYEYEYKHNYEYEYRCYFLLSASGEDLSLGNDIWQKKVFPSTVLSWAPHKFLS